MPPPGFVTIFDGNRALLDAFRRGDKAALEAVYRHYIREVDALIRRGFFIADKGASVPGAAAPQEHRELVQEVFLRAFAEPARLAYDGLKLYRPYLLRMAKNLLVDRARKKQRHVLGNKDDAAVAFTSLPDDEVTLGQELDCDPEWQQAAAATREFMTTLDAADRRFVELRFVQKQSQNDVGTTLGLTRKQVRRSEDRIRDALRRYLATKGVMEAA